MLIDQACVDTGNTLCQFTLAFFSFWIMDNYIDWSTLSCDTTHLPRYFSLWERSCPLYLTYNACFPTSKMAFPAIILVRGKCLLARAFPLRAMSCEAIHRKLVGVLWNFFRGIILSRICQRFIERELSANWLLFGRRAVYGIFRFQFSHYHHS